MEDMIKEMDRETEKEINEIKELQLCFQKCSNILKETIKLMEDLSKEEDEEKMNKIMEKIEQKQGAFMVQMIKINKFNK